MGRNNGKAKVLYFSDEEWEHIEKKSDMVKLNKSAYIKKMALNGYIINYELDVLNDFIYELNKIGVNINQIAKRVNETGSIHADEIERMQEDMACIWQNVKKSLGTL